MMEAREQVRNAPAAMEMPVRVDGVEISEAEIAREMQLHPAPSRDEARRLATEALVIRALLLQEAHRQGLHMQFGDGDQADDPAIAQLIEKEIRCPEPDAESCRRYFDNNRGQFRSPDLYDARHILLASPPDDDEARAAGKSVAQEIIAALRAEPDRFAEMAAVHSACPSRADGGSLGWVARGETVSEFETYLFSLLPGELCQVPIETRYGVHVIKLDGKTTGEALEFEDCQQEIAEFLQARSFQTAIRQYLMLLAGQAVIDGFDMKAAHSPLVQ
ncbi:MAG: peptidylprolyl isomerase [Proteobacteria bacterium]|nr:peptidylprolyl isomerase [Pseudomonadota bacterium]